MLKKVDIFNFKCIKDASLRLTPLTILTGPNSSGKSTVIQAIMLVLSGVEQENCLYLKDVISPFSQFESVLCRSSNERAVSIKLYLDDEDFMDFSMIDDSSDTINSLNETPWIYEKSFFYLSADRTGPEDIVDINRELQIGSRGQYALSTFELGKNRPLRKELCKDDVESKTLKAQLSWWLSFITGNTLDVMTEKIASNKALVSFYVGLDREKTSPFNVGSGNTYLLKLLIMGLNSSPGDLLLVENPEIHLHPAAQARLGVFLGFLASRGVQLIVETHCEHIIHRLRYEIYSGILSPDVLSLFYKKNTDEPFFPLYVHSSGYFCDEAGEEIPFPEGFFDVSLNELLEIG